MKNHKITHDRIVAALDIGATKICCAIARFEGDGNFEILSVGAYVSRGIRKGGGLVDLEALSNSLSHAIHNAETSAGVRISSAYVALPSGLQQSHCVNERMTLMDQAIEDSDIHNLLAEAQTLLAAQDQDILHAIPLSFQLDDQRGIRDPRGMYGGTLSVKLHLLSVTRSVMRNLAACLARSHIEALAVVASPYASSLAALVEDEMELGTTLIEFGGGTTSLVGFMNGVMTFCETIPLGGQHLTNDLARVFSTPLSYAERIKVLHGSAFPVSQDENAIVALPQIGDVATHLPAASVTKRQINQIIQPRLLEIISFVRDRLQKNDPDMALGRVVLTGGGAQLNGMIDFVAQNLGRKHVRLSIPTGFDSLSNLGPELAVCSGLLKYAQRELLESGLLGQSSKVSSTWWKRVRSLWSDI